MKQIILQFGFIALLGAMAHMPVHAQDTDRQARIEAHQKRIQSQISRARERRTSASATMKNSATTGTGVSVVASNLPLSRIVAQLQDQSGVSIKLRGSAGEAKTTAIFPQEKPLEDVLRMLTESGNLTLLKNDEGFEIWDPAEYQRQNQEVRVYPLAEARANEIESLVKPILTYNTGIVRSDSTLNSIIVYDVPEKQEAVAELLKKLDQKMTTRVFALKHTAPQILSQQLALYCSLKPEQVIIDERSNQIILRATTGTLQQAQFLVEVLDIPATPRAQKLQ